MIIAVEGVSAAGKTTFCRRYAPGGVFVSEYVSPKPASDLDAQALAAFWAEVNAQRWAQAVELESRAGIAFCDTDPIKLHYTWCMMLHGRATRAQWMESVTALRRLIETRQVGFADRILLLEPDEQTVRSRKHADTVRRRQNFELHLRLAPLLRRWYEAIDCFSPGRVVPAALSECGDILCAPPGGRCASFSLRRGLRDRGHRFQDMTNRIEML
jgi:nicotinamide riboside kinase